MLVKYCGIKIYHSNGTPWYDLVPVYRKSDNKTGFYDRIGKEFHPNIGVNEFDKGPDIV